MIDSWKVLTIFAKSSIVDVRLGYEYSSAVRNFQNNTKFEDKKEHFTSEGLLNICKLHIFSLNSNVHLQIPAVQKQLFSLLSELWKGSWGPTFKLQGGPWVPLLKVEGGPGSRVPACQGLGSWGPGPTFPPCLISCFKNWSHSLVYLTNLFNTLKLVSTIFYQIFIFHQMIALQKWKMFFISSKKLFSFLKFL